MICYPLTDHTYRAIPELLALLAKTAAFRLVAGVENVHNVVKLASLTHKATISSSGTGGAFGIRVGYLFGE